MIFSNSKFFSLTLYFIKKKKNLFFLSTLDNYNFIKLIQRRFNSSNHHYDIIINGGGIVGLSLLKHFQTSPFLSQKKILLLEQQKKISFPKLNQSLNEERKLSNRVSSITLATKHFFEEIEIWKQVSPFAKPISSIHTWSHDYQKGITFSPHKVSFLDDFFSSHVLNKVKNEDHICYVIENNIISNALNETLDLKLIKYDTKLTEISSKGSFIELGLNNNEKFSTSLLIACDGYNSFVRKKLNISYFKHDLKQAAIVGTIKIERHSDSDQNNVAFQRFVPHLNSVLALLPLTNEYSSFVLSVPQEMVQKLMSLNDEQFVDILNEALFYQSDRNQGSILLSLAKNCDNFLSKLISSQTQLSSTTGPSQVIYLEPNSRAFFNLHFGTTLPYMVAGFNKSLNRKIPIIGDAAHRVHPLAGQGLNLGLGDAQVLSECLHTSSSNGEDLFGENDLSIMKLNEALFKFERRRQLKLIVMMSAIHTMKDLFTYLPSHWLLTFNSFECIKNEVVKFANNN